jgi:hypothetical protein
MNKRNNSPILVGITLQVIMFSHWMLATEATTVRLCLLLAASGLFFLFWLRVLF